MILKNKTNDQQAFTPNKESVLYPYSDSPRITSESYIEDYIVNMPI